MARVDIVIPEPTPVYQPDNQRQIIQSLSTMKDQLNFSFQEDLRQELQRFTWFNMRFGC